SFAGQGWRHVGADVLPVGAVGGAQIGENSVDGIAVGNATARGPEGEAIVERAGILVGELDGPVGAAVDGFVDAKVTGSIGSDREEIGHAIADALHITELQTLGSGDNAGAPVVAAVGGDDKCATASRGPDDAGIHGADRDQALSSAAVLRSERGLA